MKRGEDCLEEIEELSEIIIVVTYLTECIWVDSSDLGRFEVFRVSTQDRGTGRIWVSEIPNKRNRQQAQSSIF